MFIFSIIPIKTSIHNHLRQSWAHNI